MRGSGGRRWNRHSGQALAVSLIMLASAALAFAPAGGLQVVLLGVVAAGMLLALIIG
ncbi:MAG TPA: hypothetical protein VFI11_13875 [Anaerolineales bacterium]|nr:hypothetical protein [Anaerolineales bacterium]